MKKICLILSTLQVMLKSNPFFTCWMFILQIMTSFAGIFFFSTVPQATADFAASLNSVRTVQLVFSDPSQRYSFNDLYEIIENNKIALPEYITFEFMSDEKCVTATTDFNKWAGRIVDGRGITAQDVELGAECAVIGTTAVEENGIQETKFKIGDFIKINGFDFEIIGFKQADENDIEIPYTTGFNMFSLSQMYVNFPSGLSDSQLNSITEYCVNSIEGVSALKRLTIGDVLMSYNGTMIIAAIFVIVIELLNLSFIYKFILKSMNKYFAVLRICGLSSRGIVGHIYAVYSIILVISFGLGTLALFIVRKTANLDIFKSINLDISTIAIVFSAFAAVISLLLIRAVRAVYRPIKEELLV